MTTFIALAGEATMFPKSGTIITTSLTPELVKARLAYPELIVSAITSDHRATIDVIGRCYGLDLSLLCLEPGQRAPQVKLGPGDELLIVQTAPISFLRWRIPMCVEVYAPEGPHGLPQRIFDEIIDHAHSIALWQCGSTQLKSIEELLGNYDKGHAGFMQAWRAWCDCGSYISDEWLDVYLQWAEMTYCALCLYYVAKSKGIDCEEARLKWYNAVDLADENIDHHRGIDTMLIIAARRASGFPKDLAAERALVTPLLAREYAEI